MIARNRRPVNQLIGHFPAKNHSIHLEFFKESII